MMETLEHSAEFLPFLRDIAKNNNKPWFEDKKSHYKKLKKAFESFMVSLSAEISTFDRPVSANLGKTNMVKVFRIYRDARFAKDKSPFKTNFGGFVSLYRSAQACPCYYVHLQPNNSFIGGGIYMPDSKTLQKIRDFGVKYPEKWEKIQQDANFSEVYGEISREIVLKTVPRGYDKDHPQKRFLQLKSFTATMPISDEIVESDAFFDVCLTHFRALMSLQTFLYEALGISGD